MCLFFCISFGYKGNHRAPTAISGKNMSYESNIDDAAVDRAERQVQEGKTAPFEVNSYQFDQSLAFRHIAMYVCSKL